MFQNHHILPHDFYRMDDEHKTFMYASELVIIDQEVEEQKEIEKSKKKRGGK